MTHAEFVASRRPKTESTWQQGANAFHADRSMLANPYPYCYDCSVESMDHRGWVNGYEWARSQKFWKDRKGGSA